MERGKDQKGPQNLLLLENQFLLKFFFVDLEDQQGSSKSMQYIEAQKMPESITKSIRHSQKLFREIRSKKQATQKPIQLRFFRVEERLGGEDPLGGLKWHLKKIVCYSFENRMILPATDIGQAFKLLLPLGKSFTTAASPYLNS